MPHVSLVALVANLHSTTILAYVDPSSSSALLQILAGLVIGALAAIKVYWMNLKMFFSGRFSRKSTNDDPRA